MTGTVYTCLHTNQSRSYLNHLVISRSIYELKSINVSVNLYFTVHNRLHLTLVLAIL